jgi:hypothetical protein
LLTDGTLSAVIPTVSERERESAREREKREREKRERDRQAGGQDFLPIRDVLSRAIFCLNCHLICSEEKTQVRALDCLLHKSD